MFFVYEDWTLEDAPRCFYVGKGEKRRVKCKRRNRHHANITKMYGLDRRIVLSTRVETDALDAEIRLIAERKTCVYAQDYIFGANYTFGGEGTSGYYPSAETRAKMSASAKTRPPISEATRQLFRTIRTNPPQVVRKRLGDASRRRATEQRLEWNLVHEKSIVSCDAAGNQISFPSIKIAAASLNVSRTMISLVLNGHRKTAKGFTFHYDSR